MAIQFPTMPKHPTMTYENEIIACATLPGETVIENAPMEIRELCDNDAHDKLGVRSLRVMEIEAEIARGKEGDSVPAVLSRLQGGGVGGVVPGDGDLVDHFR